MARFDDRATTPARGPREILRWQMERLRKGTAPEPVGGHAIKLLPNDGTQLRELASSLTWVGHATFVLKLGGKLVTTDPVWSERLSGVVPRKIAPGVTLEAMPPLDVVLITHNHRDHLDLATVSRIGPRPLYIVPLGNAQLLRNEGIEQIVELEWWQTHRVGDLEITLVPSRHWSMRVPWDRNEMLWGGYVLKGPEGVAYHSGDTALFDGFKDIGARCGPIDWALLPIGAYEPRWFMEPQHMNPDDAVQAFHALGAERFVAMHWGTFKLTDEAMAEPAQKLLALWERARLPPERLWLLDIGETRPLVRSVRP